MPKKQSAAVGEISTVAISGEMLRDKIYTIRGQRVMLDSDLAEIYGYTTSAFNQQVARNMEKFEGEDFMFRLTEDDLSMSKNLISMSQNVISMQTKGMKGGRTKMPYAFTEQGIYMLMTVLRGELAVRQSRALIRMFKSMKDYIVENNERLVYRENLELALKVIGNTEDIEKIKMKLTKLDGETKKNSEQLKNVVMRSEISPIMLDFNKVAEQKEFVLLDGQPMSASELYIDIYAKAKQNIYIIDDYIDIRTLRQLQKVNREVKVVIFSDNKGGYLHKNDYLDFVQERPEVKIDFVRTEKLVHDRFIVIDYGAENEIIYHCGASAKDAGGRITAISKFEDGLVKKTLREVIERLRGNQKLELR